MDGIIQTIRKNCRRCYSCVRVCPAKAIRIVDGQASVVKERCVACGNCTVVCSQNAKKYADGVEGVISLLGLEKPVAAMLAPSFPADVLGRDPGRLVGALREAGFRYVTEVAYGADLVSDAYREYLAGHATGLRIATACPAVVEFIRKYNPDLVDALIPIVSPMFAQALAVREIYGDDVRCVFIGPCVAKKLEARNEEMAGLVSGTLTFEEMHALFFQKGVSAENAEPSAFDPPIAGMGRVFPLVGGLFKSARLEHSMLNPEIVVLSGQHETIDVLGEMRRNDDTPLLVEAMMCRGCYSGPGLAGENGRLEQKKRIVEHVKSIADSEPPDGGGTDMHGRLDLSRRFTRDDQRLQEPTEAEIRVILAHTNKFTSEDELNCGACGYSTCRGKAVAVYRGLAEEAMCLPFMIEQAERVCHELKVPWPELRDVHRHLINSEKLASLGQMAAGVAHELNNPLGSILLYTHILKRTLADRPEVEHDLDLLVGEAGRCKKIIGMLLDFARQNRMQPETIDVAEMIRRAVETSRRDESDGSACEVVWSAPQGLTADLDRDQFSQVLVNLIKNGMESMEGREGRLRVWAEDLQAEGRFRVSVQDRGRGIPPEARDKVFVPFFTTKSIGKGTGLGLAISYGIVKMHRGAIWFETEIGKGTTFIVELPRSQSMGRSLIREHTQHDNVR